MTWQLIDTAPKDGTKILGAHSTSVFIVAHTTNPKARKAPWREDWEGGRLPWNQPTHWMPLPDPPEAP